MQPVQPPSHRCQHIEGADQEQQAVRCGGQQARDHKGNGRVHGCQHDAQVERHALIQVRSSAAKKEPQNPRDASSD